MTDLRTIQTVAPLVQSGAVTSEQLVDRCLERIDALPALHAFIAVFRDRALEEARQADADIRAGRWRGPLHGMPIAVKDLIDVAGTRTTSGSALPAIAAAADAPVIARLRAAGVVIIGKTNLHEFAFGTTSEESAFGPVKNPLDQSRSAGGSSGGSSAALAAGMAFGALGTDTGGSIRIPSAACATVGLKPTLGELSCEGVVPLSTTLDHIGPMTRGVWDAAVMYRAMKGAEPSAPSPASGRLVFGVPRRYFCDRLDAGAAQALDRAAAALTRAGHRAIDVEIEHADWTPHVYLHIVLPDAAWYHAPLLERHAALYSPGVRIRLEMGRYVLAEDYVRALRLRAVLTGAVDRALDGCDALLLPTMPMGPPPLGASAIEIGGRREPIRAAMLRLTQLFDVTGHPAIALPAGVAEDGLPRGVQLVGRRDETERLLEIALAAEPQISGGPGSVGGGTG